MVIFPNCKINLGLHILSKRTDGFHELETVFHPIPLQDALEIVAATSSKDKQLSTSGLMVGSNEEENICKKAYHLLKKDFAQLPSVNIHLHKVIPSGAGLGGGSADGAFTLFLLNRKFNIELTEKQLMDYALELGSDCPFFIKNKTCFATGRGEYLEQIELDLSQYLVVLVNPGIHISTAWAFSQVIPIKEKISIKEIIHWPLEKWKNHLQNDFEKPVFSKFPEIKSIKEELYKKGAVYASMTGSGSTVYGLFNKNSLPDLDFPTHYFVKLI